MKAPRVVGVCARSPESDEVCGELHGRRRQRVETRRREPANGGGVKSD